ncbi:MAG: hypothetical protein WKG07_04235 [Hymenobacter sp.]
MRGLAWLHHVREQLALAAELVPDFDAVARLDAWWQARQQLAPHAVELTLAPLSSLLADNDLLAAARELTRTYEDLLSHLYTHYDALRQQGAAEALSNYLLEPDLLELRPDDAGPRAGLLSLLHPLAIWKYLVMADELIAGHGPALRPVLGRLSDLPEPLRALLLLADEQHYAVARGFCPALGRGVAALPAGRPGGRRYERPGSGRHGPQAGHAVPGLAPASAADHSPARQPGFAGG